MVGASTLVAAPAWAVYNITGYTGVSTPGVGTLAIAWTPTGGFGGTDFTGVDNFAVTATGAGTVVACTTTVTGALPAAVTALASTCVTPAAGTAYAISLVQKDVSAVTVAGPTGTIAAGASTTPKLDPPTIVTSGAMIGAVPTGISGQVAVTWALGTNVAPSVVNNFTATAYVAGTPKGSCATSTGTATTCTVSGLNDGTAYTFSVVANNANPYGDSVATTMTDPVTPGVSPGLPTNVVATAASATSATVTWTAPTTGSTLASYVVKAYTAGDGILDHSCTALAAFPVTTCTDTVAANVSYYYTVASVGTNGISSAAVRSATISPATPPAAPGSANAVAGDTKATVSWTASTTPLTVGSYLATAWTGTTPAATTRTCTTVSALTCTVTGLTNGTAYTFKVVAIGNVGTGTPSSPATTGSVTPGPALVPGVPTAVTVAPGENQLMVSWTSATTNPADAVSFMATATPGGSVCSTALPTVKSCTISGLVAGTSYTVSVMAVGVNGSSAASTASAPATPLGPHSGSAVSNSDGTLQVFARSTNDHLWTSIRTTAGVWGAPVDLGYPVISAPTIVRNANGQLDVFVLGYDHSVFHRMQTAPSSTTWSPWAHVGAPAWTWAFVVETNQNGTLQMFGRDIGGNVRTAAQVTAGGLAWTELPGLGGLVFSDPTVANISGVLEVFAIGFDGALWHRLQAAPNSSTWSAWSPVGSTPAPAPSPTPAPTMTPTPVPTPTPTVTPTPVPTPSVTP